MIVFVNASDVVVVVATRGRVGGHEQSVIGASAARRASAAKLAALEPVVKGKVVSDGALGLDYNMNVSLKTMIWFIEYCMYVVFESDKDQPSTSEVEHQDNNSEGLSKR